MQKQTDLHSELTEHDLLVKQVFNLAKECLALRQQSESRWHAEEGRTLYRKLKEAMLEEVEAKGEENSSQVNIDRRAVSLLEVLKIKLRLGW